MAEEKSNTTINITFLVTIIPTYMYLCTYIYEKGYCDRFHIPSNLISLDLNNVLTFGAYLFIVFLAGAGIVGLITFSIFLYNTVKKTWLSLFSYLVTTVLIVGMAHLMTFQTNITNKQIREGLIILLLVLLLVYFVSVVVWKQIYNYYKNYPMSNELKILNLFKPTTVVLIAGIAIVPIICYYYGKNTNSGEAEWSVLANKPTSVLLCRYGDILIFKDYDLKRFRYGDSITVIKISDQKPIVLRPIKAHIPGL